MTVTENSVAENSVIVGEISGDTTSDTGNGDDATRPVVDTDCGDVVTEECDVKTTETSAGEEGETKTEEDETTSVVATTDEKTGEFAVMFCLPPGCSGEVRLLSEESG